MINIPDRLTSVRVRLIAIDAERDGDLMARWSNDAGMMRLFDSDVPRPRVARQTRSETERWAYRDTAIEWAIQIIDGDAVIGRIGLHRYHASHRAADFHVGIGDRAHWSKGYGREAVTLLLNYAFGEMDLHRVGLIVFAAFLARAQITPERFIFFSTIYAFWIGLFNSCQIVNGAVASGDPGGPEPAFRGAGDADGHAVVELIVVILRQRRGIDHGRDQGEVRDLFHDFDLEGTDLIGGHGREGSLRCIIGVSRHPGQNQYIGQNGALHNFWERKT